MERFAARFASLRPLLIFECAARSGSFSSAARAFNISQPSVSRNIAQLERDLGFDLFHRSVGGSRLTPAGSELFRAVQQGFSTIEDTVARLDRQNRDDAHLVTISVSSSFVAHWLAPRLPDFAKVFPAIRLRFDLMAGTMIDTPQDVDLATRLVSANHGGRETWDLAPEVIVAVCSPTYREERLHSGGQTILHLTDHPRSIWDPMQIGAAGADQQPDLWHDFSDYSVILQAALDGTGIALGWLSVVSKLLLDGRLVPASPHTVRSGRVHRLIGKPIGANRRVVAEIAHWLVQEMRSDIDALTPFFLGHQ